MKATLLLVMAGCFPEVAIQAPADGEDCAWYPDEDGDGVGADAPLVAPCDDPPPGVVDAGGDCDDSDASAYPGATETCDGVDEDCDGLIDEDGGVTWYRDGDGDGYGDPDSALTSCDGPPGTITRAGDCNDDDASANPDGIEVWYDGVDGDCDGASDDDADGDGYDADFRGGDDCDDADPDTSPGAAEVWYDGVDTDCDGGSDFDADGDSFDRSDDCDDADTTVFPGSHTVEVPGDGIDPDCDGIDACTDLSCDGRPDLVLPGYADPNGAIATTGLWFSAADSTDPSLHAWSAAPDLTLDAGAVSAALAEDLDGDGYLDLVLAVHHDATGEATDSWIHWGSASGYADTDRTALPTQAAAAVCRGDFDGDGATDLFFPGASDDATTEVESVLVLDVGGAADANPLGFVRSAACVFVDLDGDGEDELVAGRAADSEGRVSPATGAVLVDRDSAGELAVQNIAAADVRRILAEDFDGDSTPEVTLIDFGDDGALDVARTHVMRWTGSQLTTWDVLATTGAADAATCDPDADGDTDLVVLSGAAVDGSRESVATLTWLNSGSGLDDAGATPAAETYGATRLTAADLTGDGATELVVSNFVDDTGSRELYVRLFAIASDGAITLTGSQDLPVDGGRGHAVADLDGDGDLDIISGAWADDGGSGRVDSRIWWNDGGATLQNAFDPTDRTDLTSTAVWADPLVVP